MGGTQKMISGESQPIPVPEEETKMMGFTILQCKSCRAIVGDTSSLQIYNKETFLMTLQSIQVLITPITHIYIFRKIG